MKRGSKEYWACLRKEIRWTAVDSDVDEWGYTERPTLDIGAYGGGGDIYHLDGLAVDDLHTVPWRESLLERPHEWKVPDASTPIDAKVWVRDFATSEWRRRFYAGLRGGKHSAFNDGATQWSASGGVTSWWHAVLADPENPDREPPMDYVPEGVRA